ncbi:MAG: hypothetical protein D6712_05000 [Chloroflexi bacterium]|nr:MAG: hypothetical protein D6712_05000 [Chloroflexota bacterium]
MSLTKLQAYLTMFLFLNWLWESDKEQLGDEYTDLLSEMNPYNQLLYTWYPKENAYRPMLYIDWLNRCNLENINLIPINTLYEHIRCYLQYWNNRNRHLEILQALAYMAENTENLKMRLEELGQQVIDNDIDSTPFRLMT